MYLYNCMWNTFNITSARVPCYYNDMTSWSAGYNTILHKKHVAVRSFIWILDGWWRLSLPRKKSKVGVSERHHRGSYPPAIIRLFAEAPQTVGVVSIVHGVLLRDDPTSTPNDAHRPQKETRRREKRKWQTRNRQPYKTQFSVHAERFIRRISDENLCTSWHDKG